MLERMQSKGSSPPLLVGIKTCTATLKTSMEVFQKIGNQSTARLSNTTSGHTNKGCSIIPQGYLFKHLFITVIESTNRYEFLLGTMMLYLDKAGYHGNYVE